jgi:hypothetical protein
MARFWILGIGFYEKFEILALTLPQLSRSKLPTVGAKNKKYMCKHSLVWTSPLI